MNIKRLYYVIRFWSQKDFTNNEYQADWGDSDSDNFSPNQSSKSTSYADTRSLSNDTVFKLPTWVCWSFVADLRRGLLSVEENMVGAIKLAKESE